MRTSPHRPDMSRYQSQIPVSAVASSSSRRAARLGLLFRERWLTYPTPPTRHHSGPVTAVRGKHPVKPRQVGTWWRYQCSQFADKVQWLKDLVRGDVTARRLQLIPDITVRVSDRRFSATSGRLIYLHRRSSFCRSSARAATPACNENPATLPG